VGPYHLGQVLDVVAEGSGHQVAVSAVQEEASGDFQVVAAVSAAAVHLADGKFFISGVINGKSGRKVFNKARDRKDR
jgi:hypothetical protein